MSEPRSTARGLALAVVALLAFLAAGFLIRERFQPGPPRNIILIIGCLVAGTGFAVMAYRALRRRSSAADPPDYGHVVRLFVVIAVFLCAAGFVLDPMVPASYGQFGKYRGDAVAAATLREPKRLGESACTSCHENEVKLHDQDVHTRVPCETCHSPGNKHVAFRESAAGKAPDLKPADVPAEARMLVHKEREWCLRCHEVDPSRPATFPQIVGKEHMLVTGVVDKVPTRPGEELPPITANAGSDTPTAIACVRCHDPHQPLFLQRDVRAAPNHPTVQRCQECHGYVDAKFEEKPIPADHVKTYQCKTCHQTVADEFTRSPHKALECSSCHTYLTDPLSSSSARIVRDADPTFCLMCHAKQEYKRVDGPKVITWPAHRDAMKNNDEDKRQNCLECHRAAMHYPAPPAPKVDVDDLFGDDPKPDDKKPDAAADPEKKPDGEAPAPAPAPDDKEGPTPKPGTKEDSP